MKRIKIDIEAVAGYDNLVRAAVRAATGKHCRPDVRVFFSGFDTNIEKLRRALLDGEAPYNRYHNFTIHDPKERVITAVCFEDRVAHHALINLIGPAFEKAMVPFSYACRPGKGPLKAVAHAGECVKKYPWFVKIDVKKYFETIDHEILLTLLAKKFKGNGLMKLLTKIVEGYSTAPGKGLPIGSLTSQHFANYYLDGVDRFVLQTMPVGGYARYMDDIVWWCRDGSAAKDMLDEVVRFAVNTRKLEIKQTVQVNKSVRGVTFCGYRILPGRVLLTRRRKRRYVQRRAFWEKAWSLGAITSSRLQNAYDAVRGIVLHARSEEWMRNQLKIRPAIDA